ncbi:MAG TPA: Uma2 family endonuclease [Gemmataceae bacterium]|nr:Uma2 family endonuclease [Gemmataceae bacterium]
MNVNLMQREYTPEDLLAMPDSENFELVNGRLVERHRTSRTVEVEDHMGFLADQIAMRLLQRLANFCDEHPLGWVLIPSSGGFEGFPGSSRRVRKPDVAFVRYGRFPGEQLPLGHAHLAPDLAAEVISPNDTYEEVDQKIEEYLRAGVRLVWIISPQHHTVRVHRLNGSSHSLRENDELDGEDVVPGFRCPVRDLFPHPPAATQGGNGATATT